MLGTIHHIDIRNLIAQASRCKQFIKRTLFIQRQLNFFPLKTAITQELPDFAHLGRRVEFCVFLDILIHVTDAETFS